MIAGYLFSVACLISNAALAGAIDVDPPAEEGAMAPNLTYHGDGVLLSWLEPVPGDDSKTLRLRFARFSNEGWSEPRTIVKRNDFFANWADVPSVRETPDGWLLAHWLQKSGPAPFAYDVVLSRSDDGGQTWNTIGPAHDDGTQTEHGFVSAVIEDGGVRLFWLDGREMDAGAPHGDISGHAHSHGNMTLRTAVVGDSIRDGELLDSRVCECCNTSAAMTEQGPIIAYRDRDAREVRDISIIRRIDGRWTAPVTIHDDGWQIAGCPVNGPALVANRSQVLAAWFTAAGSQARVLACWSSDNGATFGEPVEIDGGSPFGRVDVAMDESGRAVVCWLSSGGGHAEVRLAGISPQGTVGVPTTIARVSSGRTSGFPKIAPVDEGWLVAWTDTMPDSGQPTRTRIRAAVVLLDD